MGNNRPHDKDNPRASTSPLLQNGGFDMNIGLNSDGGTRASSPYICLPVSPPAGNMQSIGQYCPEQGLLENGTGMMADFMMSNSLQYPNIDTIAKNFGHNLLGTCNVSKVPFPGWDVRGVPHCTNQDLKKRADNTMNGTDFSSIQKRPTNRNFMLRKNAAGGYQMVRQGGEARGSNICSGGSTAILSHVVKGQSQTKNVNASEDQCGFHEKIDGNFGSLEGSAFTFSHTQNRGDAQTGNHVKVGEHQSWFQEQVDEKIGTSVVRSSTLSDTQNMGQTEIGCNVKGSEDRGGVQEKIDGSFLSLGIGCNKTRSESKFSSREISNKLDQAASPELNISDAQQTTSASRHLGQNSGAASLNFQANAGGYFNPMCEVRGWTLSNNDDGVIRGVNSGPGSSPFQIMPMPQDAMQHNLSTIADRNSSFVSNRNLMYSELDPRRAFRNDQDALSGGIGSNPSVFHSSRQAYLPGLASESAKPALIPTRSAFNLLHNFFTIKPQNSPLQHFTNSASPPFSVSSTRSNHAGSEYRTSRADESSCIPQITCAQPPGQLLSHKSIAAQAAAVGLLPQRIGIPVTEISAPQAATSGLFPKRLGVEVNVNGGPQAAERDLFSKGIGQQTAGKVCQTSNRISTRLPNNLLGPPPIGQPEAGIPIQYMMSFPGPSFATGRTLDVPVQFSKGPPGSSSAIGPATPAASVYSQPSLKRRAMCSPPAPHWVKRPKINKPNVHPSALYPMQAVPPIPVTDPTVSHMQIIPPIPVAPTVSHIKWQGSEVLPQPTGQKCYICKRDLSFTPEGPLYQPAVLPAVAVLPCAHTFHDQCLQNITPEDESKEPPCIPCAINEN